MRTNVVTSVIASVLVSLASPAVWAQTRAVSPTGYGRILFPGGGGPGTATTPAGNRATGYGRVLFPGTGAPAAIRTTNPAASQVVTRAPQIQHPSHNGQNVVLYPVFFGGGYYNYGPPPPLFMENFDRRSTDPVPPGSLFMENFSGGRNTGRSSTGFDQDQSPVVIVNQYFEPAAAAAPAPAAAPVKTAPQVSSAPVVYNTTPDPLLFLIAMRDHTIYAATSYFVENETLSYTTTQGVQNTVSLDLVDRDLSRRLNRERSVAFGLPSN